MRTPTLVVTLFSFGLLTFACGTSSSSTTAPTCAQLQAQIDACPGFSQADKDSLGPFCASARATDACRSCLDGHLCGVTEQCDPQCGKSSSAGGSIGDSGPVDSGKPPPTCAQLQTQINACAGFTQAQKDQIGPFCASASATDACRSCLDGNLCGVTEQCDPQCGKTGDAGGGG
jgi:hypothetical protein